MWGWLAVHDRAANLPLGRGAVKAADTAPGYWTVGGVKLPWDGGVR